MKNGTHLGILACTEKEEQTDKVKGLLFSCVKEISWMLSGAEASSLIRSGWDYDECAVFW